LFFVSMTYICMYVYACIFAHSPAKPPKPSDFLVQDLDF